MSCAGKESGALYVPPDPDLGIRRNRVRWGVTPFKRIGLKILSCGLRRVPKRYVSDLFTNAAGEAARRRAFNGFYFIEQGVTNAV